MVITIEFSSPQEEAAVQATAASQGLSVGDWLRKVAREHVQTHETSHTTCDGQAANLSELLLNSPFAGADLDLERVRDYPRPIDLG